MTTNDEDDDRCEEFRSRYEELSLYDDDDEDEEDEYLDELDEDEDELYSN